MTARRTSEPSHSAILDVINVRLDGLTELVEVRFQGVEGRLDRIEAHQDGLEIGNWWQRILSRAWPIAIHMLAGVGLALVAIIGLRLTGPIIELKEVVAATAVDRAPSAKTEEAE